MHSDQRNVEFRFRLEVNGAGRIDQGAGVLFNLKPNGGHLTVRANPLENNLVLWNSKDNEVIDAISAIADEECAVLLGRTARSGSVLADAALAE